MGKRRAFHIYVGLVLSVLLAGFCVSGIVLNHRRLFESVEVSRECLPEGYRIRNYNNGVVRGTFALDSAKVLAYGACGVFETKGNGEWSFEELNRGLPSGVDGRRCNRIVRDGEGRVLGAMQYGVFRLDEERREWEEVMIEGLGERVVDIEVRGDSTVVMTRSRVYVSVGGGEFRGMELVPPSDYEGKSALMKVVWKLHSGELFGTVGRIVVDCVAVVMIILCVTGWMWWLCPKVLKRMKERKEGVRGVLKWSGKWHIRLGKWWYHAMVVVVASGCCLRPPLMIPLAMVKVGAPPMTSMDDANKMYDRLRGLRYDEEAGWIVCSADGFFAMDGIGSEMRRLEGAPVVSPMGITVFESMGEGRWIIGSFSGIKIWNMREGTVKDYYGREEKEGNGKGRYGVSREMACGWSRDLGGEMVFDYARGVLNESGERKEVMGSETVERQGMSLWNAMLELHVGRLYPQVFGNGNMMYVFVVGGLILAMIVCGKGKEGEEVVNFKKI